MCGVFGIWNHPEAAKLTYLGLHALQHRGQEGAGIVSGDLAADFFSRHQARGLVADVFTEHDLEGLHGPRAIGHARYSTAGGTGPQNVQPFKVDTLRGPLAIAHNGNLVNVDNLRNDLEREGAIFSTRSDTEILVHLLARARAPRIEDRVREACAQVEGAYTLLIMHRDGLIGVRDPNGYRPLILGQVNGAHVLTSESCALELLGGEFVREIEPGEMVCLTKDGQMRSERLYHAPEATPQSCIFELVYFARPNSRIFEADVYEARRSMGMQLARESTPDADLVMPVPDSGVPAALGFSEASGLPFRHGLLRSHYVGRTFIEPTQSIRNFGVKLKLSAVRSVVEGQRVVVIDDSIVRGTTSRKIVEIIRNAGAREVHVRISAPPTRFPCFYGINTPTRQELIAAQKSVSEIADYLTADSLAYLSEAGLHEAVNDNLGPKRRFCNACFTGEYIAGRRIIENRLSAPSAAG
ncbi:MAG: amidophosphoribosyltransferase [Myxococcota bacterium]